MPYTTGNPRYYNQLHNAEWQRIRHARSLLRELRRADYSVVESRREAHRALNDFLDSAVWGDQLFATDVRFPGAPIDCYITTADSCTSALFSSLAASLSWRATNTAKDVAAPAAGKRDTDPVTEQGTQDNVKRFEELVKQLGDLCNNSTCIWDQPAFEERINAIWA